MNADENMRMIIDWMYRIAYRTGFCLALVCWRLYRPEHHGALIAVWVGHRLLFVQQSYRRALSFPGGGVRLDEHPRHAAIRELVEELGLQVDLEDLKLVYETMGIFDGRRDTVSFFELHLPCEPLIKLDNREIVHAEFVGSADIPKLPVVQPVVNYIKWYRMQKVRPSA